MKYILFLELGALCVAHYFFGIILGGLSDFWNLCNDVRGSLFVTKQGIRNHGIHWAFQFSSQFLTFWGILLWPGNHTLIRGINTNVFDL